jgi:hypothetical protein
MLLIYEQSDPNWGHLRLSFPSRWIAAQIHPERENLYSYGEFLMSRPMGLSPFFGRQNLVAQEGSTADTSTEIGSRPGMYGV